MNLQILAVQAHVRSGAVYDATDPIMNNVMFDINKLWYYANDKIRALEVQVDNLRRNILRSTNFKTISAPNVDTYDSLAYEFADILFDDITYDRITTKNQIEWKEYFHAVYDLVVFPYIHDHTHFLQMVNELYKYFDVLKPPEKQLDPGDPLYVDATACMDLLRKMKSEYKTMMVPKLAEKLNNDVRTQVEKRYKHKMLELKLESLETIRRDCSEIIQWTKK
jgi:hypothetical protein